MGSQRHGMWAVANLLVGRYGAEAIRRAKANAEEARQAGDGETGAFWADVAGALKQDSVPPPGGASR